MVSAEWLGAIWALACTHAFHHTAIHMHSTMMLMHTIAELTWLNKRSSCMSTLMTQTVDCVNSVHTDFHNVYQFSGCAVKDVHASFSLSSVQSSAIV